MPLCVSNSSNASCRGHSAGRYQASFSDSRDKVIKDSSSSVHSKSAVTVSDAGKRTLSASPCNFELTL